MKCFGCQQTIYPPIPDTGYDVLCDDCDGSDEYSFGEDDF